MAEDKINRMFPNVEGNQLEAFFAAEGGRPGLHLNLAMLPLLHDAMLIIGRDIMSRHEFIVYGRDLLKKIAKGCKPVATSVLVIEVDQGEESDDLEKMIAMVRVVKGRDDYVAGRQQE